MGIALESFSSKSWWPLSWEPSCSFMHLISQTNTWTIFSPYISDSLCKFLTNQIHIRKKFKESDEKKKFIIVSLFIQHIRWNLLLLFPVIYKKIMAPCLSLCFSRNHSLRIPVVCDRCVIGEWRNSLSPLEPLCNIVQIHTANMKMNDSTVFELRYPLHSKYLIRLNVLF